MDLQLWYPRLRFQPGLYVYVGRDDNYCINELSSQTKAIMNLKSQLPVLHNTLLANTLTINLFIYANLLCIFGSGT